MIAHVDSDAQESAAPSYLAILEQALADASGTLGLSDRVALVAASESLNVTAALKPPANICVETKVAPATTASLLENRDLEQSLTVIMTARGIYGHPVANEIIEALSERITFDGAGQIEIALHEALANAVMHGSLEVGEHRPTDPEAIMRFQMAVGEALQDPVKAARPILAHVTWSEDEIVIQVQDAGPGHQPAQLGGGGVYAGRGLSIITALCREIRLRQHGRCVDMVFDRYESQASH